MGLDVEGGGAEAQDRDSKHGAAEGEESSVLDLSNAEEGVRVSGKEVAVAAAGSDENEEQPVDAS